MSIRIFLSLFFISSYCLAQSDSAASFSIKSYRPLYSAKRSLSVSPYLSYNNNENNYYEQIDSIFNFSNASSANGNGGINTTHFYRNQRQSSDLVLDTRIYLSGYGNYESVTSEAGDGDSAKNLDSYGSLHESIIQEYRHRFYLPVGRNLFTQWILRPRLDFSQSNETTKQNTMYSLAFSNPDSSAYSASWKCRKTSDQSFNLPIQLFFGHGSVYDVTSGAIAMNVFDRILGKGTSEKPAISHRVKNYANTIDLLRNKRVFDNRESFIADIAELCDSLQPESDTTLTPRQVMEIADEWQYGQTQVRMNGMEISIGPEATGYILNQNFTYNNGNSDELAPRIGFSDYPWDKKEALVPDYKKNYNSYSAGLVLIVNITYAKPLSRRFQYDGSLLYSYDIFNGNAKTVDSLFRISPQDHLNHFTLDNTFSWFANLRTTLNFDGQYTMTAGHAPDNLAYKFETRLSANSYVFPKLKFTGSFTHVYMYQGDARDYNVKQHIPTQQDIYFNLSMTWEPF